jgi:hypothetical protein
MKPWPDDRGGVAVGSIVPTGFASYARVFHPAGSILEPGRAVRWSDVAASTGRLAHPLMEWHRIATPAPGSARRPWDQLHPNVGEPSAEQIRALVTVLREFTATPERCWFCSWIGFGGTRETGARVRLPGREYFLSSGPIEEAAVYEAEAPNIWWPDDRAWCVASEIDLMATYVGAPRRASSGCWTRMLSRRCPSRPTTGWTSTPTSSTSTEVFVA